MSPNAPKTTASNVRSTMSVVRLPNSVVPDIVQRTIRDPRHGSTSSAARTVASAPLANAGDNYHASVGWSYDGAAPADKPQGCRFTVAAYMPEQLPFPYPLGVTGQEVNYDTFRCSGSVNENGVVYLTDAQGTQSYYYDYDFSAGTPGQGGTFGQWLSLDDPAWVKDHVRYNGVNGIQAITFLSVSAGPRNGNTPETTYVANYTRGVWEQLYVTPVPHAYPPSSIYLSADIRGWGIIEQWLNKGPCPVTPPQEVGSIIDQYSGWQAPQASLPGGEYASFGFASDNGAQCFDGSAGTPAFTVVSHDYSGFWGHSPNPGSSTSSALRARVGR